MLKLTKASSQAVTAPDAANLTFPANSAWSVSWVAKFNGIAAAGTDGQYFFSNGNFNTTGSLNISWSPNSDDSAGNAAGQVSVYINTDFASAPTVRSAKKFEQDSTYLFVLQRTAAGAFSLRYCPILGTSPADGSAVVVTGTSSTSFAGALDGSGQVVLGGRADLIATRYSDQSIGRFFRYDGLLTDLEVAKLAYGMEITDLGYTPTWYCRLSSNTDFADRGSSGTTFTLRNSPATSSEPAFGFNAAPSAPVIQSAAVVTGTPRVGDAASAVAFTAAVVTGSPAPAVTYQRKLAGANIADSYVFQSGDVGKAFLISTSASNTGGTAGPSDSNSISVATAATTGFDQTKVLFSPYNWLVGTGTAKTINEGAYCRFGFTGSSCTLGFDISGTATPRPKMAYRVDQGPWVSFDLSSSQQLAIPADSAAWSQHAVELRVLMTSEANSKWSPQTTAVILNSISLASGGALTAKPAARKAPLVLWLGDSTAVGINTFNNVGDATARGSNALAFTTLTLDALGVEYGLVGFGGQGYLTSGGGSVPPLTSTHSLLWAGQARSFDVPPDFIIISEGNNDTSSPQSSMVSVLNALLAATPRTTTIVMMGSLRNIWTTESQAAAAACNTPSRVKYFSTNGFFNTANSSDGRHPYGWENLLSIAPKMIEALRPIVQPVQPARSLRTISLQMYQDAAGQVPAANATGLVWAFFDQAAPQNLSLPADSGNAASIASGTLSLQVYSSQAAGAQGYLVLASADGSKAFKGPVTLS